MVYEWGSLPSIGYPEEIPEETEVSTGDLIQFHYAFSQPFNTVMLIKGIASWFLEEDNLGRHIRDEVGRKGHECTYVRVDIDSYYGGTWWSWTIDYTVRLKHSPIPAILLGLIALFAVLSVLTVAVTISIWVGAEKLKELAKEPLTYLIIIVIIIALIMIFFVWRKR